MHYGTFDCSYNLSLVILTESVSWLVQTIQMQVLSSLSLWKEGRDKLAARLHSWGECPGVDLHQCLPAGGGDRFGLGRHREHLIVFCSFLANDLWGHPMDKQYYHKHIKEPYGMLAEIQPTTWCPPQIRPVWCLLRCQRLLNCIADIEVLGLSRRASCTRPQLSSSQSTHVLDSQSQKLRHLLTA